jgi:hypothetical protein
MTRAHLALLLSIAVLLTPPLMAAPLSGTRTIGPTGNYPSITAALADVQTQTLGGPLVLELQPAYVSTVETFPLVFTNLLTTTAANTLTLRPQATAVGRVITSANTTAATVDLRGAQFVTIDGRPGGLGTVKQLTIANTSTSGVALRFINEASNNTLRHLTFQGVNTSALSGTVVFSTTTGANGNDNNTIDTCDIRDGASTPANGIFAEGVGTTEANNNSGNTINKCNICNFYRSNAVDSAGLKLSSGNTNWTVSGNSFYQTVDRAGVAAMVRAIYLTNTSDNSHTITGNFIGGTAPGAGGTAWTTTGNAQPYRFVGIWLRVGNNTATSVQGNTIKNIVWNSSSNATIQPGVWSGIHVETGRADIGTITGNTIGAATGTGTITTITGGDGGMTFGIASDSTQQVVMSKIGSITAQSNSTGQSASLTGIQVTGGTAIITENVIGSTTTPNSLDASTTNSFGPIAQHVTGIESANAGNLTNAIITDNTIANLNNASSQTLGSAHIRGIATSAGFNGIIRNTIRNLTTGSRSTNLSVVGIWQTSTASAQSISQNVIHSLANRSNSALIPAPNAAVTVTGIYYSGGSSGSNQITCNLVHSLTVETGSATSEVRGLYLESGVLTVQNNMVRLGIDSSGLSPRGRIEDPGHQRQCRHERTEVLSQLCLCGRIGDAWRGEHLRLPQRRPGEHA